MKGRHIRKSKSTIHGVHERNWIKFITFLSLVRLNLHPHVCGAFKQVSLCLIKSHLHVCVHPTSSDTRQVAHQKASDVQQEARLLKDERAVAETRSNPAGSKVVWKHARHRSREDAAIPGSSDGKDVKRNREAMKSLDPHWFCQRSWSSFKI